MEKERAEEQSILQNTVCSIDNKENFELTSDKSNNLLLLQLKMN